MRIRYSENPNHWRKTAAAVAGALLLLTGLGAWRGWLPGAAAWACGGGALILFGAALASPAFARRLYRGSTRVGHAIGGVAGLILLSLLYWFVLTPLALLLRLAGKDLLRLKRPPDLPSYWLEPRRRTGHERMY